MVQYGVEFPGRIYRRPVTYLKQSNTRWPHCKQGHNARRQNTHVGVEISQQLHEPHGFLQFKTSESRWWMTNWHGTPERTKHACQLSRLPEGIKPLPTVKACDRLEPSMIRWPHCKRAHNAKHNNRVKSKSQTLKRLHEQDPHVMCFLFSKN